MTVRLIALMSVVLLLSLGAFGLVINHYQDQLMAEVARTASEAGRAALRTLDLEEHGSDVKVLAGPSARMAWYGGPEKRLAPSPEPAVIEATLKAAGIESEVETTAIDTTVETKRYTDSSGNVRVVRKLTTGTEMPPGADAEATNGVIFVQHVTADIPAEAYVLDCEQESLAADERDETPCQATFGNQTNQFVIRIEDVRAEGDPSHGLVMTVPRFLASPPATGDETVEIIEEGELQLSASAGDLVDELRLPLGTGDYGELFKSIRDRSLFVFLGVLVVGTVLSAGVASRFTRPIRRLDAGIRRLSGGDLEVQVDVQGKDEIARLGRAFNTMTRSLRANRQRSKDLMRREKLSALGRLAAGVAHDVRNPLHSIGLTLQHLSESCRPEDDRRAADFDRSLEIIRGEMRRMDRLVGNFLQFARSDRRERRAVDLRELLRTIARLVKKEAEWRKVEVEMAIDEEAPAVMADAEAIRSSILNLVLNSFEAMPEGGRLGLTLRVEGDRVVVEVTDTGAGIAEEDQDRVFEFAYTTRESGHGLGLAMVHQCVVEEHGGDVDLQSNSGDGTRVRLALPVGDGEPSTEGV
jgi:signal transduction histidine kinase